MSSTELFGSGGFTDTWNRLTHGVYDADDHQIGWYDTLATLATGRIHLFQGEQLGDWTNWVIKDGLGIDANAGKYLIQKGFSPAWMSAQEIEAFRAAMGMGQAGNAAPLPFGLQVPSINLALPDFSGLVGSSVGGSPADPNKVATYAAMGFVGLVAMVLLTRRRR